MTQAKALIRPGLWRLGGILVSILAPIALVAWSAPAVRRAVAGGLADSFAPRLHNAATDPVLIADIRSQIDSAQLDRTLVIYLGVAALVVVAGAALRVWAHGVKEPEFEGFDFAGKCLALSAGVIGANAAWDRFDFAGVAVYLPAWIEWVALGGGIVVIAVLYCIGYVSAPSKR